MRALLLAVAFIAAAASAEGFEAAADPFTGLRFVDGRERTVASFLGQPVLVIRFYATFPLACTFVEFEAKAYEDAIEREHLPATLVLAVPYATNAELDALAQRIGVTKALWASDVLNQSHVRQENCMHEEYVHADGSVMLAPEGPLTAVPMGSRFHPSIEPVLKLFRARDAGAYRFPVDGLTDPHVQELWWMLERRKPDVIAEVMEMAKRNDAAGRSAARLLSGAQAALKARQGMWLAKPPMMITVEGLEALLIDAEGIELKPAKDRLAALLKAKELADELKARDIYRECMDVLAKARATPSASPRSRSSPQSPCSIRTPSTAGG